MYRRCVDRLQAIAKGNLRSSGTLVPVVLTFAALVSGCGSSPPVQDTSPAETAQPVQSEPEPPAAQTFPLDGETPRAAASESTSPTPTPTAPAPPASPAPLTKRADPSPSAMAAEPPLPPEAVQQFDNAVAMVNSGNVTAAEQAFRTLSAAYPTYSGPLVNLGILQAKSGKLEDAEATFKTAIERKADNAAAYNQLGIVYRRQGRFKEADEAYSRAVQIDPNYANAHLNLGVLCDLYLQQPQRALEAFERYLSLSPTPDEKVSGWVKELKVRLGAAERASGAGS